jgi:hypothetical protein
MSKMYKFDIPDFVSVPIAFSLSVKGLIAVNAKLQEA